LIDVPAKNESLSQRARERGYSRLPFSDTEFQYREFISHYECVQRTGVANHIFTFVTA
jgi:hypothetical protein